MEPPILDRPKVKITPKITKISSLAQSAEEIKKTSTKLRKTFESGTYQKKTQLTVLNRYKKRLDSIQKQNDKRFLKKQRVKIKLPEIKKFAGSFFTAGSTNDPLKAIGALAAFNALNKGSKGDFKGAIGPALVAAGIAFGPSLLRGGVSSIRNRGVSDGGATSGGSRFFSGPTGSRTVFGGITSRLGRIGSPTGTPGIRPQIGLAARQFEAGAFRQTVGARAAFPVALPGTPSTAERLGGAAQNVANRFGSRGTGVAAQAATSRAGGTVAAKAAGVGARAIPLLGAALNIGLSAYRFSEGDVVGGILSAVSAIPVIGWAALGVDLAREFGAFDGTFLGRKGKDKLEQKTEEQKKLVENKKDDRAKLTFGKTLDRYERVVNKFEEFSKNFTLERKTEGFVESIPLRTPTPITDPYTGPISGETFIPLPGATSIGDPSQGQNYGAGRGGRSHQGIDLTELRQRDSRAPIVAYKTGKVIKVENGNFYPGGGIEIDHGGGLITRYLHVTPSVSVGNVVYGGQQIGNLFRYFNRNGQEQTHLHFEVYQDNQLMNPTSYVTGAKNKITSPLDPARAKQHHESASGTSPAVSPQPSQTPPPQSLSSPATPSAAAPRVTSPSRPSRSIRQYASYERPQDQVIPVVVSIPQQMQQMMQGESGGMMMSGPSEQDLLNSFYKRVLLNTLS